MAWALESGIFKIIFYVWRVLKADRECPAHKYIILIGSLSYSYFVPNLLWAI